MINQQITTYKNQLVLPRWIHLPLLITALVLLCATVIAITVETYREHTSLVGINTNANTMPAQPATAHNQNSHIQPTSQEVIRINQASISQYASLAQHDTWWASTCSTASLAEVMNTYGHTYHISDILSVENQIGAITPSSGLLYDSGIDQTAAKFNFETTTLQNPSIQEVVTTANKGRPVIINFPPHAATSQAPIWTSGHFLVVTGGSNTEVQLADSSTANLQTVSYAYIQTYWHGFAKIITPSKAQTQNTSYKVLGAPTITADFINKVLQAHHSPATGTGQALYNLGKQYGIDPAFALAFFQHESNFGTAGEATTTLSLGNLRCYTGATCVDQDRGGYAKYATWEDGFTAWYSLIRNYYINVRRLITVDLIIPVYAPTTDNNDENAYIISLKQEINGWHAGNI